VDGWINNLNWYDKIPLEVYYRLEKILKILRNAEACYGCRICELACSFHHQGVFSPELSSIRVSRNNRTGEIGWSVDSTCDSCKGEA